MPRGRKPAAVPAPFITINDQKITWPFIMRVHTALGKEWDSTIDAFWKARNATGSNGIYRYINAGLRPNKNGIKFITQMSKERESGKMENLRQWWAGHYAPVRSSACRESQKQAIDDMLSSLSSKLGI